MTIVIKNHIPFGQKIQALGRITREPRPSTNPAHHVTNVEVAISSGYQSQDGWKSVTQFFKIAVWGENQAARAATLQTGDTVMVSMDMSKLKPRVWVGNDDAKNIDLEIKGDVALVVAIRESEDAGRDPEQYRRGVPSTQPVMMVARLSRDPRVGQAGERAVTNVPLVVSSGYTDRESGEWVDIAAFYELAAWGEHAAARAAKLRKGDCVQVQFQLAEMKTRVWGAESGEDRVDVSFSGKIFALMTAKDDAIVETVTEDIDITEDIEI